jgi:hypothetical protein
MSDRSSSNWALGFSAFAAWMMILIGTFHAIDGLAAIFKDEFFAQSPVTGYVFKFDTTTWGWIHLLIGIVIVLAGVGLFSGAVWARSIGVILAALSAIATFAYLPWYPIWSVVIITLDVFVIWALTAHGRDITRVE